MVLQLTKPISLVDIETEFTSLDRPWDLKDLYRGGTHVPTTRVTGEIPGLIEEQSSVYSGTRSNVVNDGTDEIVTIALDADFDSGYRDEYAIGVRRSMTIDWGLGVFNGDVNTALTADQLTYVSCDIGISFPPRDILLESWGGDISPVNVAGAFPMSHDLVADWASYINNNLALLTSGLAFGNGSSDLSSPLLGVISATSLNNSITITQTIDANTVNYLTSVNYRRTGFPTRSRPASDMALPYSATSQGLMSVRIPEQYDLDETYTELGLILPDCWFRRQVTATELSIREIQQAVRFNSGYYDQVQYFIDNPGTTSFTFNQFLDGAVAWWNTNAGVEGLRGRDSANVVYSLGAGDVGALSGITLSRVGNVITTDYSNWNFTLTSDGTPLLPEVLSSAGPFYRGSPIGYIAFTSNSTHDILVHDEITIDYTNAVPAGLPTQYSLDLDTADTAFTGEQTGAFAPRINTTEALNVIATDVTTAFPTVTTSIAANILTIDTNQTANISQMLTITSNTGTNTAATISAAVEGADGVMEPLSSYTVNDYNNDEVTSFTRSVGATDSDDSLSVRTALISAINTNIETPVDFMARDEDTQIKILAQDDAAITNLWVVSSDHSTGTGSINFATTTRLTTGTDPTDIIEQINTGVPESGSISFTDLLGASST